MGDDNPPWHEQSQTAKEFAAQENVPESAVTQVTVPSEGIVTKTLFTNNRGVTVLVEAAMIEPIKNVSNRVVPEVFHEDPDTNTTQWDLSGSMTAFPILPDPGLPVPDGDEVRTQVENDTIIETDMFVDIVFREV